LYPARRKAGRQACQYRDRDDPDGQGSVEGAKPAEIRVRIKRRPASVLDCFGGGDGRIPMGHRRSVVALVGAAGAVLALSSTPVAAQTVVKIGIISSYSGFVAQAADQAQKGIDLYVKEHEKDLPPGVKVELVRRDDTSNPEVGKRLAQELI